MQEGQAEWTVSGETFEAGPGEIIVAKAGAIHSFTSVGEVPLVQINLHLAAQFVQENL
ncbi:MAG TPA: cupin domain-containing protein [Bacteroidetes bacterium]|nr:cupin domain-containing protein [Bacteroidota bacterium]